MNSKRQNFFFLCAFLISSLSAMEMDPNLVIESDRLHLKITTKDDKQFLQDLFQEKVMSFLFFEGEVNPISIEKIVEERWLKEHASKHTYTISLKKTSKPIGIVIAGYIPGLLFFQPRIPEPYRQEVLDKNAIVVGAFTSELYHKQGYTSEAGATLIRYLKDHRDTYVKGTTVQSVVALIGPWNIPSQNTAKKCGFILRGEEKNSDGDQLYVLDFAPKNN